MASSAASNIEGYLMEPVPGGMISPTARPGPMVDLISYFSKCLTLIEAKATGFIGEQRCSF